MRLRWFSLLGLFCTLCGCAEYVTPGAPADFSQLGLTQGAKAALTDKSVQAALDKKPLLTFPASIAVVRVQATDYDSYSYHRFYPQSGPQRGAYSVITLQDVEKPADFDDLAALPKVSGIAPIKRLLLDSAANSDLELRDAAARLHANLLLYYTLDTEFHTRSHVGPLGVITLGIFPEQTANVSCVASAVLMDVNNGYVYCVADSAAASSQLANAWTSDDAMDQVRRKTEREAFVGLLGQLKEAWPNVIARYDHEPPAAAAASR